MTKSNNRSFLLRELHALAVQITGEEVSLIEGEVGSTWSWNWRDRLITVDPDYLDEKSADVCRAILMHECAHCALTRIHHVYGAEQRHLYQDLLNVLEDLRIESWLAVAFPGCGPWIHAANEIIISQISRLPWTAGYQAQFLRAVLETGHTGQLPAGVAPVVRVALEETREAIVAQTACHPNQAYGRAAARETLNAQQRMLALFDDKIRPVWERLVGLDAREGRDRITTMGESVIYVGSGPKNRVVNRAKKSAKGLGMGDGNHGSALKRSYLIRQQALSQVIDALANEFIELFETNSRQKIRLYQRSGDAIHIRTAMQAEADPRLNDRVWTRRLHNKRFDPLVVLALDISGSMAGKSFDAAFDGVVVLSEVCLRSGLPMAMWSFNSQVRQILKPHNQADSSARRTRIDQLRSQCKGGTSMDSALACIHASPEIGQFTHPIVFVISDGQPDKEPATIAQIKKFDQEQIPLIGIGIGPDTSEMGSLFKNSVVNVNITAVASTLCNTVRNVVMGHSTPSGPQFHLRAA